MTSKTRNAQPALALALVGALLVGCTENSSAPTKGPATPTAHDHSSMAQHGGTIVEISGHDVLGEFLHDEAAGVVSVWLFDGRGAVVTPDTDPVFNVLADAEAVQVKGILVEGAWTFTDADALGGHVDGARMRVVIGGKTFSPELAHSHN